MAAECIVNAYDMCAILGNLLDNAIEACEKIDNHNTRFIDLKINSDKDMLNIAIKNSVAQKVNITGKMSLCTSKRNPEMHGIGTQSIKSIVRKYDGECSFDSDQNEFTVHILICA